MTACDQHRWAGRGASPGLTSPMPGWVTLSGGDETSIEVKVVDLTGDGCRIRCPARLWGKSLVGFRLGGSLFAQASVNWWHDGWADLRFTEPLRAARADLPPERRLRPVSPDAAVQRETDGERRSHEPAWRGETWLNGPGQAVTRARRP